MGDGDDDGALLGRDRELSRVQELFDTAAAGQGSVLAIDGSAGAGKTRFLEETTCRARDEAFTVLSGRGSELERGFAFGLVRQALEPELARLDPLDRRRLLDGAAAPAAAVFASPTKAGGASPEPFAILSGLFWLVAAIAEHNPLVLALDDIHWADEPTLRFLSFLLPRVGSIPALIVIATRPRSGAETDAAVGTVLADPATIRLRLPAFREAEVRTLIAERLGSDPDGAFAEACLATSGGNPFLLVELLRSLAEDGIAPTAGSVPKVGTVSPENVTAPGRCYGNVAVAGREIEHSVPAANAGHVDQFLGGGHQLTRDLLELALGPDELLDLLERCDFRLQVCHDPRLDHGDALHNGEHPVILGAGPTLSRAKPPAAP